MIKLPLIHFDCRHFMGSKPCSPNKEYGIFCEKCTFYEKNPNISGNFPDVPDGDSLQQSNDPVKIVIIKLDAVGDVLRTTSILPSLKSVCPASSITWITKQKSFEVLKDNNLINRICFDEDMLQKDYDEKYDIAFNLDTGDESCEIMKMINAEKKFGYTSVNRKPFPVNKLANEWYLMGIDDNIKKKNKKTYHRLIHEICGIRYKDTKPILEITEGKRIRAAYLRDKHGLHNYSEFILINLGGGSRWQYKKWTKEGYAELINKLSREKPGAAVGAVAGMEDMEFYNEVLSLVDAKDNVFLLGCGNSVEDFICYIYLADKIFTSDSLAFHIAAALGKFVIVIVGPTSYSELDVFGNGKIIHSSKMDCLVCYLNTCAKTVNCMNTVSAEQIIPYFR